MKKWAVFFGLVIVAIIVLADTRHLGPVGAVYDFPYEDKVGHFVLFGLLSLLVNLAVFERWPARSRSWLAVRTSVVLAILIGLEELSQRLFPSRSSSIWDLLASYLRVAVFVCVAMLIDKRKAISEK